MKLVQLDLTAFGPFANQTLDFSQGQLGLHLVYGPNEAGMGVTPAYSFFQRMTRRKLIPQICGPLSR